MFLAWRTQLREAQQASELGRLDEAAQRLAEHKLLQYKPGEDFARQLAGAYLGRAMRRAEEGNFGGARHDLEQARTLDGGGELWRDAEQRVARTALAQVESLLLAGDFSEAQRRLVSIDKRTLSADVLRTSQEAIRRLESATNLAKRGKFVEAEEQLAPAVAWRPEWRCLAHKLEEVRTQAAELRTQSEALHAAMLAGDWNQALAVADALLVLAPELRLARDARQKAWAQVGSKMTDSQPLHQTHAWPSTRVEGASNKETAGIRFMLWIDAVGGFLVCLADEIWIGQAAVGNPIAVPILAELSRRHAKLVRSGEGYVLEASQPVTVNGRPVDGKCVLTDGDELELGRGVRLRFCQPHSLSATARLEILSRHRTQPYCDAILLMAESCVLGPKWQNHVVCKDWANDVVLFRQQGDLFCRAGEPLQIDGVTQESRGALGPHSHVLGEDFSFSLELL